MASQATDPFTITAVMRSWKAFSSADPGLLAGAVAYNVFFALAPLSLALLGVASLLGRDEEIREGLLETLRTFAPPEVVEIVASVLDRATATLTGTEGFVIVLSLIVSLYAGSRATFAVLRALTLLQRAPEVRPYWKRRLLGIGLTILGGGTFLSALLLTVVGSTVIRYLAHALQVAWLEKLFSWVTVPLVLAALFAFLTAVYTWGPPRPIQGAWWGALFGTIGTMAASWGFGYFSSLTGGLGGVVGAVATLGVLLVWLYVGAYIIFLAAFVAGEASRTSRRRMPPAAVEGA